ncbi:hypothetical protein AAH991_30495 [Microbispora sp. ZYX-F-249]|uniref:Uncharacterized protein n=1 Tax=Microbispora maris TaxID=3144104 RepID=A0ABV0B0L6_9ACTN
MISQDDQGPLLNFTPPGLTVRPHLMSTESYQRLGELFALAAGTSDVTAADLGFAELELDAGRPDRSARDPRQGLVSAPAAEQLWRALMRAWRF